MTKERQADKNYDRRKTDNETYRQGDLAEVNANVK